MSDDPFISQMGALWAKYKIMANQFECSMKYQDYDDDAYDGEGAYTPGPWGFLNWIEDGCPEDGREPS